MLTSTTMSQMTTCHTAAGLADAHAGMQSQLSCSTHPFKLGAVLCVPVVPQHVQHLLQHLRAASGSVPAGLQDLLVSLGEKGLAE